MIFIILLKKTHIYIFFQIIDYQLFNFDMILNLISKRKISSKTNTVNL